MKKALTLCIIHNRNKLLLGMKKRGFGQGRWNGFGGKAEEGETIEEAAKRELFEEAGIKARNIEKLGIIDFSWKGKTDVLEVNIFKAREFEGEPKESDEMRPQWFDVKDIPFDSMWKDDKYWMPLFLENKKFKGKFIFDDKDNILDYKLEEA